MIAERKRKEQDPGREELVREILAGREAVLQALWAHQLIDTRGLRTNDGAEVRVVFPGWVNRVAGPDFKQARLEIAGRECFGDVEIHLESRGWTAHGHHNDPVYGDVVLHVVVRSSPGKPPHHAPSGRVIPELSVEAALSPEIMEALGDAEAMLQRYENLPGRCGLKAAVGSQDAVATVIARAAETRARLKAERIAPDWDRDGGDQMLFELVFQSLGYRPYAALFRALAARYPLSQLTPFLELPYEAARAAVLARWFGALGLLDPPLAKCGLPQVAGEYDHWRGLWLELGEPPMEPPLKRGATRPWNSPERRMVGLFHHLYGIGRQGWFKGGLKLLHWLDGLRDQPDLRKAATRALAGAFDTPSWEPWRHLVSFQAKPMTRGGRLIGADRITIVMANAVVPFFLAYARHHRDSELEKLIYRLFIVLPPEAPNRRTRFMERRLMPLKPLPKNLRNQQGLLQIHQDFCTSYDAGCVSCQLPDMIGDTRQESIRDNPGNELD